MQIILELLGCYYFTFYYDKQYAIVRLNDQLSCYYLTFYYDKQLLEVQYLLV